MKRSLIDAAIKRCVLLFKDGGSGSLHAGDNFSAPGRGDTADG